MNRNPGHLPHQKAFEDLVMIDSRQPGSLYYHNQTRSTNYRYGSGIMTQEDRRLRLGITSLVDGRDQRSYAKWSDWLVCLVIELGIEIDWLASGSSASVIRFGITSSLDGAVIFNASLHAYAISRSHSEGSAMHPGLPRYR